MEKWDWDKKLSFENVMTHRSVIQRNSGMTFQWKYEIFGEKVRLWSKVSFLKLDGPSVCHLQEFTASRCQCWNTVLTSFLPWIAKSCNVSVGNCCTLGSFEIVGFVPVVQTTESAHLSLQIRINGNKDRLTPVPSHLQQIKHYRTINENSEVWVIVANFRLC